MNKVQINYSLPHIIHNNLINLIKGRSKESYVPKRFPDEVFEHNDNEKEKLEFEQISINQSCNVNIILNSTAIVENSLECILISPFNSISSDTPKIIKSSLSVLKSELIKISSLGRYFDMYQKLYNNKVKNIIEDDELICMNLLFDIRHLIIHCSVLSAEFIEEDKRGYLYVNDSFYLEILNNVKKIMNLENDYYCLPESLLSWNNLVDQLLINSHKAIVKITDYSKNILPSVDIPLFYYGIGDFITNKK